MTVFEEEVDLAIHPLCSPFAGVGQCKVCLFRIAVVIRAAGVAQLDGILHRLWPGGWFLRCFDRSLVRHVLRLIGCDRMMYWTDHGNFPSLDSSAAQAGTLEVIS